MEATSTTANSNPLACPGLTAFALRLIRALSSTSAGAGNLVFSPLSIYAALALTSAGAKDTTLRELLALLGAKSGEDIAEIVRGLSKHALADRSWRGGPRVSSAFGVWHDETLKLDPAFSATAARYYKAETRAVDFRGKPGEAVKQINAWAAAATDDLIDSILADGQVSAETDVVVANAVYFKGRWHVPFREENTVDDKFHRLNGSTFHVSFMRGFGQQYIARHKGFKVLKLRYKEGRKRPSPFSMCIFLPDARHGLHALVEMTASSPDFIGAHLPTSPVPVGKLRLPRFELAFSDDMSGILRDMGLEAAFDGKEADLSGMVGEDGGAPRPLALSRIIHKAVIEVNEEGTEAVAVTASMKVGKSAPKHPRPVPVDFVADHPFAFFVIEERSGAIVFAGNVLEPSPSTMPMGQEAQSPATKENINKSILPFLRHYLSCLFS